MSSIRWLPLESNPEVINKFLEKLGVPSKWGTSDIFSLDDELLAMVPRPVLAVLLLFPISDKYIEYCQQQKEIAKSDDPPTDKNIFFMYQTIKNSCGTIALIHAVANNRDKIILDPDTMLGKFIHETKELSPLEKGEVLERSYDIIAAYEATTEQDQTDCQGSGEKCPHYIALVQVNGKLYELDGRKLAPVLHGDTSSESFLQDAARICKEYMQRDPENLNFTALSLGAL